MQPHSRSLLIAAAVATAGAMTAFPVHAQTVRDSVEAALAQEPSLEAAEHAEEAARARVRVASAGFLPNISIAGEYGSQEVNLASGTTALDPRATSVTLSQLLFSGGRVWSQVRAARAGAEAAGFGFSAARSALIVETAGAYAALANAQNTVAARERADLVFSERLAEVEARRREGIDTLTDLELARAQRLRAQAELELARAGLAAARARYQRLTGLEPPAVVGAPVFLGDLPDSEEDAAEMAVAANFGVRAAGAGADAADAGVWAARSAFSPQVELRLESSRSEDAYFFFPDQEIETTAATVRVRIPLFEGGRRVAEEQAARAERARARAQERAARSAVAEFARSAFAEIEGRRLALQAAEAALTASRIVAEGTRRERSEGLRTTADILEAEQALLDAEVARSEAATALFVAQLRLADALAILTPESLN
jgi:outer membrane protein